MNIHDSLSGKKINFVKPKKGALKLFVCGPTVYDYSHIGHARTYIFFDAFVKYLRSQKIKVTYLQNITDVDDKIIKRAKERKISPISLARDFEKHYKTDVKKLGINSVNKYARASEHMKEIQKQIETLIKKGFAYQTGSGVYFNVKNFKDYGKLSKQNLEELKSGTRIESESDKKDVLDFALWKLEKNNAEIKEKRKKLVIKDGEPLWPSPWGWGRPGWHIEDTAITEKYFGPQYDIHGGGVDLKFPHHEAEIAQQEAASGKDPLVKIWMHTGFLLVNGEKMSKSLGNFITIREFLKKYPAEILRFMVLSNHYRSPFDYSETLAEQTKKSLDSIKEFLAKLEFVGKSKIKNKNKINIKKFQKEFENSLNDDFNTPKALAVIFNLISENQKNIWNLSKKDAKTISDFVKKGLKSFEISIKATKIPLKIKALGKKRDQYRSYKQFIKSDELRDEIKMLGYIIEDTPLGSFIYKRT